MAGTDSQGHATRLYVTDAAGEIDRIDLTRSPAQVTTIASGGAPLGAAAIGADGCLYVTDLDRILRVSGQGCSVAAAPAISLTRSETGDPATGSVAHLTATLSGAAATPIHLTIDGPNARGLLTNAGSAGYAGVRPGIDHVVAWAVVNGAVISSAPLAIHWVAGKRTTFLSLDGSPQSGPPGTTVPATPQLSAKAAAALACTKAEVVLIDVSSRGGRVRISGAARGGLVGRNVTIKFLATRRTVATTTVRADGTFAAGAPLPAKRLRTSARARYVAIVGDQRSAALKLYRRASLGTITLSGRQVALKGHVAGAFRTGASVRVQLRVTCASYRTVGRTKLSKRGTFTIKLPPPTGTSGAVHRAQTTVVEGHKRQNTYTLPLPIG